MAYKTYDIKALADFSGRPEASYTSYATVSALPQALLLFKLGTCIVDPAALTPDAQQLVDFAILSVADVIFLGQEHQAAAASPFSSESIGSYSYSKLTTAVRSGLPTGLTWFDMAVEQIGVCDANGGDVQFGGVEMFEHQGTLVAGSSGNNIRFLGPDEKDGAYPVVLRPEEG